MKEIKGYLIDRTTGEGISGKSVSFVDLDGDPITVADHGTVYQTKDTVTQSDGSFSFVSDLSPGPINVEVDVSGSEFKVRKFDEKAQMGIGWSSDIGNLGLAIGDGFVRGYLNELAPSVSAGNIRIATGMAIVGGKIWSIEHGTSNTGFYTIPATANAGGSGINPRLDLVTLRQYLESAAGQLSGRQAVVVTLGTSSNVTPPVTSNSGRVDIPLAVISTPAGGSPSLSVDRREFVNPSAADRAPIVYAQPLVSSDTFGWAWVSSVGNTSHPVGSLSRAFTVTGLNADHTYHGLATFDALANTGLATVGNTYTFNTVLESTYALGTTFNYITYDAIIAAINPFFHRVRCIRPIRVSGVTQFTITAWGWREAGSSSPAAIGALDSNVLNYGGLRVELYPEL